MWALLLSLFSTGADAPVTALAIAPDGKTTVAASQDGVFAEKKPRIPSKLDHIHDLKFSPDGKTLAIAGGSPAEFGAVELWSWPQLKLLATLKEHTGTVYAVAWVADGKQLATASADRTVRLWDVTKRKSVATLKGHSGPVLCLSASKDGKWLCSGSADHTIRVWDPQKAALVRTLTNHLGPVLCMEFRPPQKGRPPYLASGGGDKTVRVWQPSIGRLVRIMRFPDAVTALTWNETGSQLFVGEKRGYLSVFDGDSDELQTSKGNLGRIAAMANWRNTNGILVAGTKTTTVPLPRMK